MNPVIKNIIAVIIGLVAGSLLNMLLIQISSNVIPPPEGADVTTVEGLKKSIHLFQPKHFIFPFLAHSLGTLLGAFLAALIAANNKLTIGLSIGAFFLIGGIVNSFMLPAPTWFVATDLLFAYLPMGWLGWKLMPKKN